MHLYEPDHLTAPDQPLSRQFLEGMQLRYHEAAEKAGVYVVGACGFDSIPADMGTCFVHDKFDGDLNGIESYFRVQTGPKVCSRRFVRCRTMMPDF